MASYNIVNQAPGSMQIKLPNSSGKIYTVTALKQAWDILEVQVTNGSQTFSFKKDTHSAFRILTKPNGMKMAYATSTSQSDNWTIKVINHSSKGIQPALASSYVEMPVGSGYVHTLTVVAEDRPGNAAALDYNDAAVTITWYNRRG